MKSTWPQPCYGGAHKSRGQLCSSYPVKSVSAHGKLEGLPEAWHKSTTSRLLNKGEPSKKAPQIRPWKAPSLPSIQPHASNAPINYFKLKTSRGAEDIGDIFREKATLVKCGSLAAKESSFGALQGQRHCPHSSPSPTTDWHTCGLRWML